MGGELVKWPTDILILMFFPHKKINAAYVFPPQSRFFFFGYNQSRLLN